MGADPHQKGSIMEQVQARPQTVERLRRIAAEFPDLCPGYIAEDGMRYRVIHLKGFSGLGSYLSQYEGAVLEWLPGHNGDADCNASCYKTMDDFGAVFSNLDLTSYRV